MRTRSLGRDEANFEISGARPSADPRDELPTVHEAMASASTDDVQE